MTALTRAVQAALAKAPCSARALAEAAGVPQPVLWRIQAGEREATPAVARAVAGGLARWSTECRSAAARIERQLAKAEAR